MTCDDVEIGNFSLFQGASTEITPTPATYPPSSQNIRKAEVAALNAAGQLFVVETEQMQEGDVESKIIGFANVVKRAVHMVCCFCFALSILKYMSNTLRLDAISTAEKLQAMEAIWEDLSRNEANVESPAWHEQVLKEREARLKSGKESPLDWETAKKRLRSRRS